MNMGQVDPALSRMVKGVTNNGTGTQMVGRTPLGRSSRSPTFPEVLEEDMKADPLPP